MVPVRLSFLALVSLAAWSLAASSDQQPIVGHAATNSKATKYNITLDFDDLPTNASGIGFHPADPNDQALLYKDLYLQSFTLQDTLNPALKLNDSDILCATSAPHALFFQRREGFDWPRISLHDLSRSPKHNSAFTENSSFSLVSFTMSPTGFVPGKLGESLVQVVLTMLKLPPDATDPNHPGAPAPKFPDLVHGAPWSTFGTQHTYQMYFFLPPGEHISRKWYIKDLFYEGFGTGVDVVQITAQWLHVEEDDNGMRRWSDPVDWEICADDFVFEVDELGFGRKEAELLRDAEEEWVKVPGKDTIVEQIMRECSGGMGYVGLTDDCEIVYGRSKDEVFVQMFGPEDLKVWQEL